MCRVLVGSRTLSHRHSIHDPYAKGTTTRRKTWFLLRCVETRDGLARLVYSKSSLKRPRRPRAKLHSNAVRRRNGSASALLRPASENATTWNRALWCASIGKPDMKDLAVGPVAVVCPRNEGADSNPATPTGAGELAWFSRQGLRENGASGQPLREQRLPDSNRLRRKTGRRGVEARRVGIGDEHS
jgi:hypothetical protein